MLNAFKDDNFFNLTTLTEAINILPNQYGRVCEMGLFQTKGVRTRSIALEEQNDSLCLLPTQALGGPTYLADRAKRKVRMVLIRTSKAINYRYSLNFDLIESCMSDKQMGAEI